jgi:hypothetical protein
MIIEVKAIDTNLPAAQVQQNSFSHSYQIEGELTERNQTGVTVSISGGAFYSTYVDDAGDTYLVGGQVSGGTGNFTEADIKIIDHVTGPMHTAGTHMVLGVTGTGYAVDGVLLAGFTATASAIAYVAIPDNTVPTATSLSGKRCYINLGVFTETGFQPAGSGNISVSFCPSTYTVHRF